MLVSEERASEHPDNSALGFWEPEMPFCVSLLPPSRKSQNRAAENRGSVLTSRLLRSTQMLSCYQASFYKKQLRHRIIILFFPNKRGLASVSHWL